MQFFLAKFLPQDLEATEGRHQVELVVVPGPSLRDGGGVGENAGGSLDLGQFSTGADGRGLVVEDNLEASGAPVDELDGPLGLDARSKSW